MKEKEKLIFYKTLKSEHFHFDLCNIGEGSISQLTMRPYGLELDNRELRIEIDGQVVDAEIADLNLDGYPEILIYSMSAGSGSYGEVIGYTVNEGKSISEIYFPNLSTNKKASQGYRGHDQFRVVMNILTRRFPVYNEGDTNAYPSVGMSYIEYALIEGEATKQFEISKFSTTQSE